MFDSKLDVYNSFYDSFDAFINSTYDNLRTLYLSFSENERLEIKRKWSHDLTNVFIEENELVFNKPKI